VPEENEEGPVYDISYCPNKAEEHEEGDGRALKRLLEAIVHRKNSTFELPGPSIKNPGS
jgi:hypothetical protein